MRVTKIITGWLCVLALAAALTMAGLWLDAKAYPFFHGGAIHYYHTSDPHELAQSLGTGRLNSLTETLIKEYVKNGIEHSVHTGWPATITQIIDPKEVREAQPDIGVVAAVIGPSGWAHTVYPKQLGGRLPRFSESNQEAWESAFHSLSRPFMHNIDHISTSHITDPSGKRLGTLAVARVYNEAYAVIPRSARKLTHISADTAGILAIAAVILHYLLLVVWTGMDAGWRGMRPFAWGALTFVTGWVGLLAYLIARLSPPKPCPNCGEEIVAKYKRCPSCGITFLSRCPVCRTRLKPGWQYCPKCTGATPGKEENTTPVRHKAQVQTPALKETKPSGAIRVIVTDVETGAPVPDVKVIIQGPSSVEAATNQNGIFEARKLPSGEYTVTAIKAGFEPGEAGPVLDESTSFKDVLIKIKAQHGAIGGRVLDRSSDRPLTEARVYLDTSRIDRSALSDANGEFLLTDIPVGPYTVRADKDAFASQMKLAQVSPGGRVRIEFILDSMLADEAGGEQ